MRYINISVLLFLAFGGMNTAFAGYGIDCNKPDITNAVTGAPAGFSFTCMNNTPATFSSFAISAQELDLLTPATVNLSVSWPDPNSIKPGDVGTVIGSFTFPSVGQYVFDFTKRYGGDTYSGIFCRNGSMSGCVNVTSGSFFGCSGTTAFTGTRTEPNRIFRDNVQSSCAVPKAFPGPAGAPDNYYFETFTYNNNTPAPVCLTVTEFTNVGSSPCLDNVFVAAYLNSYDPANIATNYLGDIGGSTFTSLSFSVTVPAGNDVVLAFNNVFSLSACTFGFQITPCLPA